MKLTHHIKTSARPHKALGVGQRGYDTPDREPNFGSGTDKRLEFTPQEVYSSRSANTKLCPYDNNLIYSQVNDRINQFSNGHPLHRDLPQPFASRELEGSKPPRRQYIDEGILTQTLSKMKSEVLEQVYALMSEYKTQASNSLKEAIVKVDEGLKKECIIHLNRQFLPLSFMDDSQKQFQEMEDRIKRIQASSSPRLQGNYLQRAIKAEQEKNNMALEIQKLKQTIQKLEIRVGIIQSISNEKTKCEQQKRVQQTNRQESQLLNQIMKLKMDLRQIKMSQEQTFTKLKQLQLATIKHGAIIAPKEQCRGQMRKMNSLQVPNKPATAVQSKLSIEHEKLGESIAPIKSMSLTFSLQSLGEIGSPKMPSPLIASIKSLKEIKSSKYLLDNSNNLMDDAGNYILDDQGNHIKLSEEQLLILKESSVVHYQQL